MLTAVKLVLELGSAVQCVWISSSRCVSVLCMRLQCIGELSLGCAWPPAACVCRLQGRQLKYKCATRLYDPSNSTDFNLGWDYGSEVGD